MRWIATIYEIVGFEFRFNNWTWPWSSYRVSSRDWVVDTIFDFLINWIYCTHRWLFAHTNPDNVDRLISVSAPHPNLIWDNLQSNSAISDYWLKFIQLPYLPEIHFHSDSRFIESMLPHLNRESKYIQNESVVQQIPKKIDAYKYVKVNFLLIFRFW